MTSSDQVVDLERWEHFLEVKYCFAKHNETRQLLVLAISNSSFDSPPNAAPRLATSCAATKRTAKDCVVIIMLQIYFFDCTIIFISR